MININKIIAQLCLQPRTRSGGCTFPQSSIHNPQSLKGLKEVGRSFTHSIRQRTLVIFAILISCSVAFSATARQKITLDQEIGQMLMIGFSGDSLQKQSPIVSDILHQRIGGVILFDYNYRTKTFDENIKNPKQLKLLTQQLKFYTKQAAKKNHNALYPLFIGIDYEGGNVNRLNSNYGFPETVSAAYLGRSSLATTRYYANRMANTLKQENINLDFAPVLDLNLNPNNPIIGKLDRSFSASPSVVISRAAIFSQVFKQKHILCTYKHFPGHGDATADSHLGFVDETNTWHSVELEPYANLFKKPYSCDFVMVAHIVDKHLDSNGYPATLSHQIITDLLRKKLNFKGIVVSDDMQMEAITKYYTLEKALPLAINAGVDILVFGNQLNYQPDIAKECIQIIKQNIKNGTIPRSRIDEAYYRIMKIKKRSLLNP